MAAEIFIDTSGFYALLVRGDDQHDQVVFHRLLQLHRHEGAPAT